MDEVKLAENNSKKPKKRSFRMTAQEALDHEWIRETHANIIKNLQNDLAQRNYAIGALISLDLFEQQSKFGFEKEDQASYDKALKMKEALLALISTMLMEEDQIVTI